jgi:hypothetical protein
MTTAAELRRQQVTVAIWLKQTVIAAEKRTQFFTTFRGHVTAVATVTTTGGGNAVEACRQAEVVRILVTHRQMKLMATDVAAQDAGITETND